MARALVNDPALLLADEPTGNLDSGTGHEIMEMLKGLNEEGQTIVLVTHEHDIAGFARRQVHLKDGVVERDFQNGTSEHEHTSAPVGARGV
jgi:putative ABC transport system ATP-binding protein